MRIRYATYSRLLKTVLGVVDRALALAVRRPPRTAWPSGTAPERILLCSQGHLGDAILATALLPALRAAYPGAKIGMLVHPGSAQLVSGHPEVEWVHTVEHWHLNRHASSAWSRWQGHRRSQARALAELRDRNYQLALDSHPFFPNSLPLLWRAGIPRRVGWSGAGFGRLVHEALDEQAVSPNILARHALLLARVLGTPIDTLSLRPSLKLPALAAQAWLELGQDRQVPPTFIAVHVGAHAAHKRWTAAQWLVVVQGLAAAGHAVVLLGASPEEVAVCGQIAAQCPRAVDLSGCLSLDLLLAVIASCRLLLSHDSVAAHIASAFDRPCVSLVPGIQDPSIWHRTEPRAIVLTEQVPCAPCHRSLGCATMACLRTVPAARVLEAVRTLLARAN